MVTCHVLHNILSLLSEDTGAYHRGIVFSDDQGIYVADIRILTSEFSNFDYKTIYSSNGGANNGQVGEIQFMVVDAVDRKVIFVANGSDIYSLKIDVTNTDLKHIISVVNRTEEITGRLLLDGTCGHCKSKPSVPAH